MTEHSSQLKDPRTCRIFFSSPFGGMEGEREELTRKYFPQIHHLCNSRGIQFVPVDMRWGITTEAADNAQTINICLRELDQSDVFVGFFGQRYGWYGKDDAAFQRNIDNAVARYPWLEDHRGKSVTEMEFLHGHLNNPGALPAVICFRDKKYDDMKKLEGESKGDKKQVYKYSPESNESTALMDDLKQRVDATRDKTLGVDLCYETPEQAARFIFEAVWKHLTESLLPDSGANAQSQRQISLTYHDAFLANRSSLYIGGHKYFNKLHKHLLEEEDCSQLVVRGAAGCGKSALLSCWIQKLKEEERGVILAYHFIGTAPDSDQPLEIQRRLHAEVEYSLTGEEPKKKDLSTQAMLNQLERTLETASEQTRKVILIIDGLDKVKKSTKTDRPLYWLPKTMPKRCRIVVSTKDTDSESLDTLKSLNYTKLEVEDLAEDERTDMCVQTLKRSGKELSPDQLKRVVLAEHSRNAFFLKVTISELSVFGYFRKLDEKIDSLIQCDGVGELFQEYLTRLEQDYNVEEHPGNLVRQVMTSLLVSHKGMTEKELKELHHIPDHVWSPLFFALETYVINRSGLLGFAFSELRDAVQLRYCKTEEERVAIMKPLVDYFVGQREDLCNLTRFYCDETRRVSFELPWLQRSIEDLDGLATTLANLWVMCRLVVDSEYEYFELWKATKMSFSKVTSMMLTNVDTFIATEYLKRAEQGDDMIPPGIAVLDVLQNIDVFLRLAEWSRGEEEVIRRSIGILENIEGKKGMTEAERKKKLVEQMNSLAIVMVHVENYDEAMAIHQHNIQHYQRCLDSGEYDKRYCMEKLGWANNGIALLHYYKQEFDKALEYNEKAFALYKQLDDDQNLSSSLQNIALIYVEQGRLDEAVDNLLTAKKMLEKIHFDTMHHDLGNILTNLALCYRRQNKLDEAEAMYKRSLEIKAAAVGWDHPIVAKAYLNLGVLEMSRGRDEAAEEYSLKVLEIYKVNEIPQHQIDHRKALENYINVLQNLGRHEEAEPLFNNLIQILEDCKAVSQCLPHVFNDMARHYHNLKRYDEAERVLLCLMTNNKATVLTYFMLDVLDSIRPPTSPRPEYMTLKHGLELWPGDPTLGTQMAKGHLIPSGDTEGLLKLLSDMVNENYSTAIYEAGSGWCDELGKKEMAVEVLKAAIERYPDHVSFKTNIVDYMNKLKMYTEGAGYAQQAMEVVQDNPGLSFIGGYMCLMAGQVDVAVDALNKVLGMGNEDMAARAKDLLEKIAAFQSAEGKKEEDTKTESNEEEKQAAES